MADDNSSDVFEVDDNLKIIGTAHISKKSINTVKEQIKDWQPDIVAIELCDSRLKSLKEPGTLESETLLKIINDGKAPMVLLQSALSAEQRRMGLTTGEKPGAELLAAVNTAEEHNIPIELIDRDVIITLRRAWSKMKLTEKWKVMYAMLWSEDDDEIEIDDLLEDSDMLSNMLEEARKIAPGAGIALIDERDVFLSEKIRQMRGNGKILAVVGAGHVKGIIRNLEKDESGSIKIIENLNQVPKKSRWPKVIMLIVPLILFSAIGWLAYNGEFVAVRDAAKTWIIMNMIFAAIGIMLARGHPLSVIVGAIASPITSLNPTIAAGWFAGYTQFKISPPTGKDAKDFLAMDQMSIFWKNKVGKVLLVTVFGNLGSTVGAWLGAATIVSVIIGM
ncbi:MAG: TraB/GumN family protein [Candidatus Poseidoniales archaeon]|jgi:pheromone shutdown-related protein TraB|tara:strand:- start:899 stop:2071 length:1173 start_codon:yes stop_codon:yes gene_type:complete